MNDPSPTKQRLAAEAIADRLLTEQDQAVTKFRDALSRFSAAIAPLTYPLGAPCAGYDLEDIDGTLESWRIQPDPKVTADKAWDAACEETAL